jgi:uncharacterized protein YbaR (Trm112 family)
MYKFTNNNPFPFLLSDLPCPNSDCSAVGDYGVYLANKELKCNTCGQLFPIVSGMPQVSESTMHEESWYPNFVDEKLQRYKEQEHKLDVTWQAR